MLSCASFFNGAYCLPTLVVDLSRESVGIPKMKVFSLMIVWLLTAQALAAVTPHQAARLGQDLTPMGAEKAGNAAGTIPAWKGGISQPLNSYQHGDFHADPFPNDKIRATVNSKNWQGYEQYLTPGQIALLKKFPSYSLQVYPSHRSAAYPQFVYDAVKKNAVSAKLLKYGTGVSDTIMSSPFPIPKTGAEVMWNHTLRYRGLRWEYTSSSVYSSSAGDQSVVTRDYKYFWAYSQPGVTLDEIDNKIFYLKHKTIAPASMAGSMILVHETLDQVRSPRKAWIYSAGQRRVRRTPNLSYSSIDTTTNGIRTIDQVDMFNGAPNLYNWKLLGKAEKFVPYNAYKLHQKGLMVEDIAGQQHINPKLARYELHRVWVVEANLRVGVNHVYHKRRFYFDEDSWQIVSLEEYDEAGALIRHSESHMINYYDIPMMYSTLTVSYDLENGRYFADGLNNERAPVNTDVDFKRREFTATGLRREAR